MLKDPLTHFTIIGLSLFALFVFLDRGSTAESDIVVSLAQQRQIEAAFTRIWRRPPNSAEAKGLIDDWVREELASREAVALGLDDKDLVIRRRLRQKYESLMEQIDSADEPSDETLRDWYAARADNYRREAKYTLQQQFFSTDRRTDPSADAAAALPRLAGEPAATPVEVGDPVALPRTLGNTSKRQLADRLGPAFSEAVAQQPLGRWSGPVPSAYGYHLVFVESAEAEQDPAWRTIRDVVMRDWRAEQLRTARETRYSELLKRYKVVIESDPAGADEV